MILWFIYTLGIASVFASAWTGQKMDTTLILASGSEKVRVFLRWASSITSLMGFVYFFCGFFVFGWYALLSMALTLTIFYPASRLIISKLEDFMPLICLTFTVTANLFCTVGLLLE